MRSWLCVRRGREIFYITHQGREISWLESELWAWHPNNDASLAAHFFPPHHSRSPLFLSSSPHSFPSSFLSFWVLVLNFVLLLFTFILRTLLALVLGFLPCFFSSLFPSYFHCTAFAAFCLFPRIKCAWVRECEIEKQKKERVMQQPHKHRAKRTDPQGMLTRKIERKRRRERERKRDKESEASRRRREGGGKQHSYTELYCMWTQGGMMPNDS